MEILKVILKDGVFENVESENSVEYFANKKAKADDWYLKVDDEGTVIFKKNYWSFFRLFSVVYTLEKNGLEKLVIKRNGEIIKTIRKRKVLPKGQVLSDGIFYLETASNEMVDILFKNTHLYEFRKKHYLTEIVYTNPNRKYILRTANKRIGYCKSKLSTDGKVFEVRKTTKENVEQKEVSVVGATWTILEVDQEEYDDEKDIQVSRHIRELTTLQDPLSIKNLKNDSYN